MAIEPFVKPRSYKIKKNRTSEIPTFEEWKSEWEFASTAPVPMGNPWSKQPFEYAIRSEIYRRRKKPNFIRDWQEQKPWIAEVGDVMPHISKRQITRFAGKGIARLHPIGMAISIGSDLKLLYDLSK